MRQREVRAALMDSLLFEPLAAFAILSDHAGQVRICLIHRGMVMRTLDHSIGTDVVRRDRVMRLGSLHTGAAIVHPSMGMDMRAVSAQMLGMERHREVPQ